MIFAGGINCTCEHDYVQERLGLVGHQSALRECIEGCIAKLDEDICLRPGTTPPESLSLVLGHALHAHKRLSAIAAQLNGDGIASDELQETRLLLVALELKLEEMWPMCELRWQVGQVIEGLDAGDPWTRMNKSAWQLHVEDREVDRQTPPEHVPHYRAMRDLLVNEDLDRETRRLNDENQQNLQ